MTTDKYLKHEMSRISHPQQCHKIAPLSTNDKQRTASPLTTAPLRPAPSQPHSPPQPHRASRAARAAQRKSSQGGLLTGEGTDLSAALERISHRATYLRSGTRSPSSSSHCPRPRRQHSPMISARRSRRSGPSRDGERQTCPRSMGTEQEKKKVSNNVRRVQAERFAADHLHSGSRWLAAARACSLRLGRGGHATGGT